MIRNRPHTRRPKMSAPRAQKDAYDAGLEREAREARELHARQRDAVLARRGLPRVDTPRPREGQA